MRNYYTNIFNLTQIFLSIITFFFNQKSKEYTIIISISILISFYLFEGYLIFKNKTLVQKSIKKQLAIQQLYKNQTGKEWDRRTKLEIYDDLKKINNEIVLFVGPGTHEYKNKTIFSLSGISNSKTIYCNENGYYSFYQSDRYGFNNPDEEWDKRDIEYLLVGDSHTHGACVNRPHDIASVLRKLSNKSVLNLGMGGNGPLIEMATLREYLDSNVKKVLWIFFENDWEDLHKELGNKILIKYLDDPTFTQNLKFRQNDLNFLKTKLIERERLKQINNLSNDLVKMNKKLTYDKLISFIKLKNARDLLLPRTKARTPAKELKIALKLSKDLSNKNNSKFYIIYLPHYARYNEDYKDYKEWNTSFDKIKSYNLLKNIADELKIPFIDIHKEVFFKEQNPLKLYPFEVENHYTIECYKKISEAIYEFTKD